MASAVHIPFDELHAATQELLDRAQASGEIFIDKPGTGFKILTLPGRTAKEALELLKSHPSASVEVDEDWANDMQEILALRHSEPDRDPWA